MIKKQKKAPLRGPLPRKILVSKADPKTTNIKKHSSKKVTEKSTEKSTEKPIAKSPSKSFPIVGIGASAGGIEALTQLFSALPMDTGMAFVVVQHLDPTIESASPEILSRATRMPVEEIKDAMRVLPNHVYVMPSNCDLTFMQGELKLLARTETRGLHLVIDSFFLALARDQGGRAIGVILSGTASDGTQGLKAIKAEGGLAVVQDPKTAKYEGMPKSAIASGIVDLILAPQDIAQELARISKHPYIAAACEPTIQIDAEDEASEEKTEAEARPDEALRKIFVLLRIHTQVDFSNYKHSTLKRRIERRMMVRKTETFDAYAKYLQDNPSETKALYADILIHVTEFFRDPDSFKALTDHVFPSLLKNMTSRSGIRIWVPGCSTGEEAYSLAIVLLEFLGSMGASIPIQIFATDISEPSIQKARAGVYSEDILSGVSKERLKRFFDKTPGGYKINKAVRDLCLFSKHDVTSDPPFSKLDIVSCRNLLIYFAAILQKSVFPVFHYALNPGGFLWLGRSESPGWLYCDPKSEAEEGLLS